MKAFRKLAALVLAGALCMSAFTGCGINPDETAATLGEQKVSLGLVNFIAKYQKATMDDLYVGYFGEEVWDVDMTGSGTTLKENLLDSVVASLHDLYTLKNHMADYKVEISADDEKAIKDAAAKFMADNSKEAIKEFGATEELVVEMLTLYTIQSHMYDAIIVDTDREVSDEDANMRGFSYIVIDAEGHTVDGKYTEYTDDELTALMEKVNKIGESLKNGSTLEDVAKEYNYEVEEGAYATKGTDESIDEELLDEMKDLKEGETSSLIKGADDMFYFARIDADTDEEATEENREAIISEREGELYTEVLEKWQKDDGWKVNEDVVGKIEFHHFFTQDDGSTETESGSETESESGTEKTSEK